MSRGGLKGKLEKLLARRERDMDCEAEAAIGESSDSSSTRIVRARFHSAPTDSTLGDKVYEGKSSESSL